MWIKICATTNLEDALLAARSGADAVGFVFAPSPRRVTTEQVRSIVSELPSGVERIGVFASLDFQEVCNAVQTACLTGVQLHRGFSPDLLRRLRDEFGPGLRIIQTAHWTVGAQNPAEVGAELSNYRSAGTMDAVLVDSRTPAAEGGTGVAFDWLAARAVLGELGTMPLIVAGGLSPDNVAEAVRTLHPWGVDVASGVELHRGKKDPARVEAFIRTARAAFAGAQPPAASAAAPRTM